MPADEVERAASAVKEASRGRHLLLLLDFDGTLVDFNSEPEAVFLSSERRQLLLDIHNRQDATVAIVSGRRLSDVRHRAALPADNYHAGLHGLEIEGHGETFAHPDARSATSIVRELVAGLPRDLEGLPGVLVEDKTWSVVLHFRAAAPEDAEKIPAVLEKRVRRYLQSGQLRIMHGACMIEVLPNTSWNKGKAVEWIRERVAAASRLPLACVYVGDDVTDQDAFGALGDPGIAIASSRRVSGADFYIDGPTEVEALLRRLTLR